jgi:hypothetical protein
MRTGRPAFHIKARWITIDTAAGSYFYKLDDGGKLILINNQIQVHHFVPAGTDPTGSSNKQLTRDKTEVVVTEAPPQRIVTPQKVSRPASITDCWTSEQQGFFDLDFFDFPAEQTWEL